MPRGEPRLTARARQDIRAILRSSLKRFGPDQQEEYADRLEQALARIAEFPHLGRERDDLGAGQRTQPVAEPVIVYRPLHDGVLVVRVLDARRDVRGEFQR